MIIKQEIISNIKIERLEDLYKIKPLENQSNIKLNISAIARELGKDPRTIKKYINGYTKPKTRNKGSSLDKYYNIIKELLNSETQIFYYKRNLWNYLKDNHGLKCPESTFKSYIYKFDEFNDYFKNRSKKAVGKKSVIRFETEIGKQAQLDWKESMNILLASGEHITVNIFVLILAYSRFRVYRLSLTKKQDVLFNFMTEAFEIFEGVPKEILTDNMKTVMDSPRTEYNKGKVNNKFKQFADDYGFKVRPCIAGRPNTKAKVESPMKLLDELYAYNGMLTYEELNNKVTELNNRINNKVHVSTGKIPVLNLQKEKDSLSPLPVEKIRSLYKINTNTVNVNPQSLISYKTNLYSVPPKYIGKRLQIQVYDKKIYLYYNTKLVALHDISSKKLNYSNKHYKTILGLTLNNNYVDINKLAKQNLKNIGEIYKDE